MKADWVTPTVSAELETELKKLRRKKTGRQFPWQRGPIAWKVACRADAILESLASHPRNFFSLHRTAKLFGVSTQPVRDWVRDGHIKRAGPRQLFRKDELCRFIEWLSKKAKSYNSARNLQRIYQKKKQGLRFGTLMNSKFHWPTAERAFSPSTIAKGIKCHPSLIRSAIRRREVKGRRRSRHRWEILRKDWRFAFPRSDLKKV